LGGIDFCIAGLIMKHRFRFLGQTTTGRDWQLDDDEIAHVRNVLRIPEGELVEVTNGQGSWAVGSLRYEGKKCAIDTQESGLEAPSTNKIGLAVGALKPATIDDLLPMITELGVDEIFVFLSRGIEKNRLVPKVLERWQKIIRASVKQCKRNYFPVIKSVPDLPSLVEESSKYPTRWLATPGGQSIREHAVDSSVLTVIGSEKGLEADEEKYLLDRGFLPVSLSHNILRAETACTAAVAFMQALKRP
jgi:16S rRNA (uracil1498-N3)-methyltransferase